MTSKATKVLPVCSHQRKLFFLSFFYMFTKHCLGFQFSFVKTTFCRGYVDVWKAVGVLTCSMPKKEHIFKAFPLDTPSKKHEIDSHFKPQF